MIPVEYRGLTEPWCGPPGENSPIKEVTTRLFAGVALTRRHSWVQLLKRDDVLDGETDVVKALPEDLEKFIATVPIIKIQKDDERVKPIDDKRFDEMPARFEEVLNELWAGEKLGCPARLPEVGGFWGVVLEVATLGLRRLL